MCAAWVDEVKLRALYPGRDAEVAIASVPLPREDHSLVEFDAIRSQAVPIAWYAGDDGPGLPRRVLLLGIGDRPLQETIGLRRATSHEGGAPQPGPAWELRTVHKKKTGIEMREVNELLFRYTGRELALRMGIRLADRTRWWEWVQVEELWAGPVCRAIRAGGYIGVLELPEDQLFDPVKYNSGPLFHKHNWLFAEVYALLFANGLIRVTARHVNNRFFDQGRDLEGFVPVIGFALAAPSAASARPRSPMFDRGLPRSLALDGERTVFDLGGIQLDIGRARHLISAEHPGQLYPDGEMLVYQPYEGVELHLGDGKPTSAWTLDISERAMWKGMARSVGFDLSFGDRPIETQRYLLPYGWYGHCGALWSDGVLPARGELEPVCDEMLEPRLRFLPAGRFYDPLASWDGESAHGLMLQAYRTGRPDVYDAALRSAYATADYGIDHAEYTIRLYGQPRPAVSLTLQRTLGLLSVYLETGDPYLLRCAESVSDAAYAWDRSNWPRRSFGRDAAYIRGLVRLYDVTGERFYLRRAGEACRRVVECQRPDGSFADQGGTFGTHGHLNEIIKPWMNSILLETLVDYLERVASDPLVEQCAVRTADWLLSVMREDEDGPYWPYQVAWGENEEPPQLKWHPDQPRCKHPYGKAQLDYNARSLLWVTMRTGDAKYARAWMATFERCYVRKKPVERYAADRNVAENFPWHEAHLWGARLTKDGLELDPILDLIEPGREAVIELPCGSVRVRRTPAGAEILAR